MSSAISLITLALFYVYYEQRNQDGKLNWTVRLANYLNFFSELLLQIIICYICQTLGNHTAHSDYNVQLIENEDGTVTARFVMRESLLVQEPSEQSYHNSELRSERVMDEIMQ